MAIGTPAIVINSTATTSNYSGSYDCPAGTEWLLVFVEGWKSTAANVPSALLTVTFDGVAMAFEVEAYNSSTAEFAIAFVLQNPNPGNLTLAVSGMTCRSLSAVAMAVTGAGAAAVVASGGSNPGSNQTDASFGRTTVADGNALASGLCLRAVGDISAEVTITGGATGAAISATGTNTSNDHTFAHATEIVPTAAPDGHGYQWTTSCRIALVWVELAQAAATTLDIGGMAAAAAAGDIDIAAGGTLDIAAATAAAVAGGVDLIDPASLVIDIGGMAAAATAGGLDVIASGSLDLAGAAAPAVAGDLSLPPSGVTQPLSITPMPFDGYVFDSPDKIVAPVTISGLGTTGDTIQVRGASAGGNTAWVPTIVDVAGNWTVTFDVALALWGNWYTPEARIGTDDLTGVSHADSFGCGHVVMIFGQSEPEYILNTAIFYNPLPYPVLAAQNLTMITQAGGGSITPRRITTTGIGIVSVAMVAIANALAHVRDGRKVMICDAAVSGESRISLASDGNPGRDWTTEFAAMIGLVRSGGSDIGDLIECYYNADAATIDLFTNEWSPFYFGQRAGGGAFVLGTPNPDSIRNPSANIDHCLWDVEVPPDQRGRGIFARARTKLHIMTPMPFHDTDGAVEQRNFTHNSTGALISGRNSQLDRPARDMVIAFAQDSRVQTFLGSIGPSAHVVDFGGGIHPLTNSQWGNPQFAMNFLPSILRATGMAVGEPTIIGVQVATDGSYADVVVDLPNDGDLATLRILAGLPPPATQPPHYQAVNGLEIRRAADADSDRRPVMKLAETSYPAPYRGTVTIIDAGTGVSPARTGRVRITPEVPFITGDRIEYLRGEVSGHLLEPRDVDAQLFLDQLIEHVPALYDPAALYPMRGIPVQPQPAVLTLSLALSIDIAAAVAAAATGGADLAAGGAIDMGGATAAALAGGIDIVDPVADDLIIGGMTAGIAMAGVDLAQAGTIAIGGVTIFVTMGALDLPLPGNAPRRAAYAAASRAGGTLRAGYG